MENERGEVGYKYKNDVYRPTVRITKETPCNISGTQTERDREGKKGEISKR